MEYRRSIQHGHLWRSRWSDSLGLRLLKRSLAQAGEVMRGTRVWTIEDREALSRALKFSAAASVMATLAWQYRS